MILHLHIKIVNENEGLEKANRGDEYEPIKIPLENSAYVLKSIHHASLLTRSTPHSYRETIDPPNRVSQSEITVEDDTHAIKISCKTTATKNRSTNNSKSHAHFIEHLVCMLEKSP
jgi:hypothetical protein